MNLTAPRGTQDILPPWTTAWQWLERKFQESCELYQYQEIRIPTFEHTELFQRGVGASTDVVQKEMYTFEDKAGRSLTLRPEGTAGTVRSYIDNGLASQPSPVKLYYQLTAFRYEKMQKGRYREFHQMGCECIGSAEATADAELISLLSHYFNALGLSEIQLKLNSIGCPKCRPIFRQKLMDYLRPHLAELCEDCKQRFEQNPMRILDCKQARCAEIAEEAPAPLDYLCDDCREHWESLKALLEAANIPYQVDRRIVRGLDYYTRTVFEYVSSHVGTQGTICGGGRYDGLVEEVGGQPTPAVGFAMGVERLLLEAEGQKIELPQPAVPQIFVAAFPETQQQAFTLCTKLRAEGLRAALDICGRSMKAQLKYANRMRADYLLLLGADELAKNCAKIKKMSDGSEVQVHLDELASVLRSLEV